MLGHVVQVVSFEQREALLMVIGQEVAGDEMQAPGAQLGGVVQLGGEEETWKGEGGLRGGGEGWEGGEDGEGGREEG